MPYVPVPIALGGVNPSASGVTLTGAVLTYGASAMVKFFWGPSGGAMASAGSARVTSSSSMVVQRPIIARPGGYVFYVQAWSSAGSAVSATVPFSFLATGLPAPLSAGAEYAGQPFLYNDRHRLRFPAPNSIFRGL